MTDDPIVAEVRAIREAHAKKFNYDLHAMFLDLKEQEEKARAQGRQFVSYPPKRIPPVASPPVVVPETPASAGDVSPAR